MKLYLVRHGDAVSHYEDSKRSLSQKGQEDTVLIGDFLSRQGIEVPQVYHSEKERALQTANILANAMSNKPKIDVLKGLMPEDAIEPIAEFCNALDVDVMLVGHLPFMPLLAAELLSDRSDTPCIEFQTSAILCLERAALSQWCLRWFISPDLLLRK